MLVELTPEERRTQEIALPQIFDDGFHPERIDWYTRLTVESDLILGGVLIIPEFIAAMVCESSLNNNALGDSNPDVPFGVGWMQFDTEYHAQTMTQVNAIRSDPLFSLQYAAGKPDLTRHSSFATSFRKQRWHAWEDKIVNPSQGWNPLKAAYDSWMRVTSQ